MDDTSEGSTTYLVRWNKCNDGTPCHVVVEPIQALGRPPGASPSWLEGDDQL